MTARASNWSQPKFIDGAIHVLQTEGYLTQGMATMATKQDGKDVTWRIAGKGEATEMAPGIEERPTLNADRTTVTGTMKDYEANEWINVMDLHKMSENEIQVAEQTVGYALGRKYDRVLFEALDAGTYAGGLTIGNGTTAVDPTNLTDGLTSILGQGIQSAPEVYCGIPYKLLGQLMMYRELASSDWQGNDRPLMKKMGARSFMNINIVPFPDEYFNVPSANQAYGYMWLKSALGLATPTDAKAKIADATRIDYVPTKKAHFVASTMSCLGKILLPEGIRRLHFATNLATTRPTP